MSVPRTRKRWLELLRRTAGVASEPRSVLDDAALWEARDRATRAAQEAEKFGERVAATAARQRANVDAAAERASGALARRDVITGDVRHVLDSLERLGVVGLNVGLEGARTAEPQGRALTLVSEELRGHVGRGADAARDLGGRIDELLVVVVDLAQRIERAQRDAQELSQDSSALKTAVQESLTGLEDLGTHLRKATGVDPETARFVSLASDHAKGLLDALTALEGSGGMKAASALSPVLLPVMRLLSAIVPDEPPSGTSGSSP